MALGQYIKDTRAELRHVAWPTRTQTVVYAVLVAAVSVGIALYLGLFDFLFTTGLTRGLQLLPASNVVTPTQQQNSGSVTMTTGTGTEARTVTLPVTPQGGEQSGGPTFTLPNAQ